MRIISSNLGQIPQDYSNLWKGVWINSFGDSITSQKLWQPKIYTELETSFLYYGIGGAKVAGSDADSYWQDSRISDMNKNVGKVMILGGANDFSQSVYLGDINSVDTDTFLGAWNILMDKLLFYWSPNDIILITTGYSERSTFPEPDTNPIGLKCEDYANAVIEVSIKYNTPLANYFVDAGVGHNNLYDYTTDGVHPNDAGAQLLADSVIKELRKTKP